MENKARIVVTIKNDVLDPAGTAVKQALVRQGLEEIEDVRIGKVIDIALKSDLPMNDCLAKLERAAKGILCNPVVEDFTIDVVLEK